jgi:hypothetical protein
VAWQRVLLEWPGRWRVCLRIERHPSRHERSPQDNLELVRRSLVAQHVRGLLSEEQLVARWERALRRYKPELFDTP